MTTSPGTSRHTVVHSSSIGASRQSVSPWLRLHSLFLSVPFFNAFQLTLHRSVFLLAFCLLWLTPFNQDLPRKRQCKQGEGEDDPDKAALLEDLQTPWNAGPTLNTPLREDTDTFDHFTHWGPPFVDLLGADTLQAFSELFPLPIPSEADSGTADVVATASLEGTLVLPVRPGGDDNLPDGFPGVLAWPATTPDLTQGYGDSALHEDSALHGDSGHVWPIDDSAGPIPEPCPVPAVSTAKDPGKAAPRETSSSRPPPDAGLTSGAPASAYRSPYESSRSALVRRTSQSSESGSNDTPSPPSEVIGFRVVQWTPDHDSQPRKRRARGPFTDKKLRQQTGETRRIGACVRCVMQKTRVR